MSFENSLWGATKIHGELLKLGIAVAQSTVSVYMVPRRDRPLQTWKTFLCNHMEGIASIDLFVVPTIAFDPLFACLVLGHKPRQLLWFAVTRNPPAEWLARQITEAFPWGTAFRAFQAGNVSFWATGNITGNARRPSEAACAFCALGGKVRRARPRASLWDGTPKTRVD
jgi:hypothetical protein